MPVTKEQAEHIAALAVECRPHGARQWTIEQVIQALGEVRHMRLADVAMAALRGAADRDNLTPKLLANPGSDAYRERLSEPHAGPVRQIDECPAHVGELAANCRSCAADRLGAGEPAKVERPNTTDPEHAAEMAGEVRDIARKAAAGAAWRKTETESKENEG